MATSAKGNASRPPARLAYKAATSAFLGFFVDMFDVYLPVIVLAPAYAYFEPNGISPATAAIAASLIFASTLLGRPVGSVIFGFLADKVGRKPITMISVGGFGVCTLLIALLPGYATWGEASLYLLIFIRFVDGIFLGGEYTSANVLAMEFAPKERRGWYGAVIQAGYPAAYMTITVIALIMLRLFPTAGGLSSPYVAYGWRIPFFIGAIMAFAFILPFRASIPESNLWEAEAKKENPFKVLFGQNLRPFLQVFLLLSGLWFLVNSTSAIMPMVLSTVVKLAPTQSTAALMVGAAALIGGYLLWGVLGQRYGRRPTLAASGILAASVGTFLYYLVIGPVRNYAAIIVLVALVDVILVSGWAVGATTYLNERFPTRVRSSGFGMGYTLAVIIPSFYAFYQGWLANIMPSQYTVLALIVLGGVLVLIAALIGPETRDVDLSHPVTTE